MPTQSGRGILSPDIVVQLKTLFGTARNAHARLGLGNTVLLAYVSQAFSGYEIPQAAEERLVNRWEQWRRTFLAKPIDATLDVAMASRNTGDYFDEENMRDPETGHLLDTFPRFTLL